MKNVKTGKMMKTVALALALAALLAVCAACSVRIGDKEKNKDDRPYVICTIFPQYDFLKNIVGDTPSAWRISRPRTSRRSSTPT